MTTAIEARLLPKIPTYALKYGTLASFTLYATETIDTDTSSVVKGPPTVHQAYILPPTELEAVFDSAGSLVKKAGIRFFLPSGALTSSALAFVPELGLRATVAGVEYRVDKVETKKTGDQVAGFWLEARA